MRPALLLAAGVLLAGCSASSDDEPDTTTGSGTATASSSSTSRAPGGPSCTDVWIAGRVLPDGYRGCVIDGQRVHDDVQACRDGTRLVTHLDAFYAVTGGTIVEPDVSPMQDTDQYGAVFSACTGQ